jgi:hypothetical protein
MMSTSVPRFMSRQTARKHFLFRFEATDSFTHSAVTFKAKSHSAIEQAEVRIGGKERERERDREIERERVREGEVKFSFLSIFEG